MVTIVRRFQRVNVWTAALAAVAAVAAAACGSFPSSPQPVQASNPSVTYNYRTDGELLQANRNATTYCSQYQTVPRTVSITNNPDGSRAVVFECVRTTSSPVPGAPAPPPGPPVLSYTYRTDQELVQASQTAGDYCVKNGSQPMTSSIVTNPNGTRTVTFQCGLR